MNIDMEIIEKPKKNINREIKICSKADVIEISEVKAIRNAVKEYLLFIGLDRSNNVRNITVLGVGSSHEILVDNKEIIRIALLSASEKVILVHNHPANSLEPSFSDVQLTNHTTKILEAFSIKLLDHIIVTENNYVSMRELDKIDHNYESDLINKMTKGLLIEENKKLKQKIEKLQEEINLNNNLKVISAKCEGGYNDTICYSVEILYHGDKEQVRLERSPNKKDETKNIWKIYSNIELSSNEQDKIIKKVSSNPPSINIDDLPKKYEIEK